MIFSMVSITIFLYCSASSFRSSTIREMISAAPTLLANSTVVSTNWKRRNGLQKKKTYTEAPTEKLKNVFASRQSLTGFTHLSVVASVQSHPVLPEVLEKRGQDLRFDVVGFNSISATALFHHLQFKNKHTHKKTIRDKEINLLLLS